MTESFLYVTYIRTTPEKIWEALTREEFTRQFWFGMHHECEWQKGAPWKMVFADGRVADAGEVLEIDPPRRMALKWHNEFLPDVKADGDTRCTIEIEQQGELAKLTIHHEADWPHKLISKVGEGWPKVLSSLKSWIETGEALPRSQDVHRAA
jgi:uncharacterized protein YndB with AHSA1/START domain